MKLLKRAIKVVKQYNLDNMKTIGRYFAYGLMIAVLSVGCSQKISNDRIDKLEGQEAVLKKTTDLNKYKIELEKYIVRQGRLQQDVEQINQKASASAREAEELSTRVSRNPGEPGLANRANRASKQAAKDSKDARRLNNELADVNEEINDLRKDIDKTEKDLNDLRARVEFVPNS